jgi:hypothetical protein
MLLVWEDDGAVTILAIEARRAGPGSYYHAAVEVARTDSSVMRLRAGSDADVLRSTLVTVIGVGAIGSELAVLLARSGVGHLVLADGELLRPGNLTRHSASGLYVGLPKAKAIQQTIADALPHVRVDAFNDRLWDFGSMEVAVKSSNLVVDASGNRALADYVSRLADARSRPMVSVALHRGGAIGRVRVQAGDLPADPSASTAMEWETGCGAPINIAPPGAVTGIGAIAARVAIDVIAGRVKHDGDYVEVFDPIAERPFDTRGTIKVLA